VIHLLKLSNVSVHEKIGTGKTPYELSVEHLKLSSEEKETIHSKIISKPG
jgi:hypothetical protein